jgi:hypothetical protein
VATVTFIKQKLYHMVALNLWICERCNDGFHYDRCLGLDCDCPCRGASSPKRSRRTRDKNGLTPEDRERQMALPFESTEGE